MRWMLGMCLIGLVTGCQSVESIDPEIAEIHFGELRESLLQTGVPPKEESQYIRYPLVGFNLGYERSMKPLDAEMDGKPRRILKEDKTVEHYPVRVLWEITEVRGNKPVRSYQEWRKDNYYYRTFSEEVAE